MIRVTNQVETVDEPDKPCLLVHSHRLWSDRVILEFGESKVTVLVSDLQAAIKNASNTARY